MATELEVFRTDDGPFATFPVRGHRETAPLVKRDAATSAVGRWLIHRFREKHRSAPRTQAVTDVVNALAAQAEQDGPEREVSLRLAAHGDAIYWDLANDQREVVAITRDGWQLITDPPVRFWRPDNMAALPRPEAGGRIQDLKALLNFAYDDDFILLVLWILAALQPEGPYVVLLLSGEQGSAKSTTAKLLRRLIDPVRRAPTRALPKDERELRIAAHSEHLAAFTNVSTLTPALSDALCRMATADGFAARELYTDRGSVVFGGARPIIVDGIVEFARRPDFLDRAWLVHLPPIPPVRRKSERELWIQFDAIAPGLVGVLCDAITAGLRHRDTIRLRESPRMADAVRWVVACARHFKWSQRRVLRIINANHRSTRAAALAASVVADAVQRWADARGVETWVGTATELLSEVKSVVNKVVRESREWPSNARTFAERLRREAPLLQDSGIHVTPDLKVGHKRTRLIEIKVVGGTAATTTVRPPCVRTDEAETKPRLDFDVDADAADAPSAPFYPKGKKGGK